VGVVIAIFSIILTRIRVKITLFVSGNLALRVKLHSAYGNRTLRVEINLVRVETILVLVGIIFVSVAITLRVEMTLCV
jgi:hypothetical protein